MVKAKTSRVFASSFFFLLVVLCRRHAHSHTFSSHYKHAHHRETARLGTTVGLGFACCCWLAVSPLPLPAAHTPKPVPTVFFLSVSRPVVAAAKDEEKKLQIQVLSRDEPPQKKGTFPGRIEHDQPNRNRNRAGPTVGNIFRPATVGF